MDEFTLQLLRDRLTADGLRPPYKASGPTISDSRGYVLANINAGYITTETACDLAEVVAELLNKETDDDED